jgi:hypothetical protein
MRINVKTKGRRLETISQGDILVFKDREEIVEEVNNKALNLFTTRLVESSNATCALRKDFVAYKKINEISTFSKGEVYDSISWKINYSIPWRVN